VGGGGFLLLFTITGLYPDASAPKNPVNPVNPVQKNQNAAHRTQNAEGKAGLLRDKSGSGRLP